MCYSFFFGMLLMNQIFICGFMAFQDVWCNFPRVVTFTGPPSNPSTLGLWVVFMFSGHVTVGQQWLGRT